MRLAKLFGKIRLNPNTPGYWDRVYDSEISTGKIRQDGNLIKILPMLGDRRDILDFGSGAGGNIKLLSAHLRDRNFHLLEQSERALEFAKNNYLKERDSNGNSFHYFNDMNSLPEEGFDVIMAIQVLEHISNYPFILQRLWGLLNRNGLLVISVPVKGWLDRNREHVNKFTITSMFRILTGYSDWVHITPRTYSTRSGRLNTAFFLTCK